MGWGYFRQAAVLLPVCALASPALAQEEDTQLWVYAVAKTDLGEDISLAVDFTARWREQRRGEVAAFEIPPGVEDVLGVDVE